VIVLKIKGIIFSGGGDVGGGSAGLIDSKADSAYTTDGI
jgi:hypothetical protein